MALTKNAFKWEMDRVIKNWGAENYAGPRMEEIWKVVKDLDDKDFSFIVARIVGEVPQKYPPTVKEFREFAETKLKEIRDKRSLENFVTPKVEAPKFESANEALDDVKHYFHSITSAESFPAWLKTGFEQAARGRYPQLAAEVNELKEQVKAGNSEVRAEYVQKAKKLITKTATSEILKGIGKALPLPEYKGGLE